MQRRGGQEKKGERSRQRKRERERERRFEGKGSNEGSPHDKQIPESESPSPRVPILYTLEYYTTSHARA